MKRIILLFMAVVAVAIFASARVPFSGRPVQQYNNRLNMPNQKAQGPVKGKTRLDAASWIPDGEVRTYNRSGQHLYIKNGYLYRGFQTDKVDIVYADNNVVYIKNILSGAKAYFGDDFWVQGTINEDGDLITVPLGQTIFTNVSDGCDAVLAWGSTVGQGESVSYQRDKSVTVALYSVDGETISFLKTSGLDSNDGYDATGLSAYWSDDDSWIGFIECNTVLTQGVPVIAPEVISELPQDCFVSTYAFNGECAYGNKTQGWSTCATMGTIQVAFADNGIVYIHNPLWRHSDCDSWVKGSYDRETGMITVPTGQYLAWSDKLGYGIQLKWGSTYIVENGIDDNGEVGYELRHSVDEHTRDIRFQLEDDKLFLLGCNGNINVDYPYNYAATGMMAVYSDNQRLDALELNTIGMELRQQGQVAPSKPVALAWFDSGCEDGYSYFEFQLPTTDINGDALNLENLSYSIYTDQDQIFTFRADTYFDLTCDMTEIPYELWSGSYDFYSSRVYFYRTNYNNNPLFSYRIGIQAHYTVDGVKNSSDISYDNEYSSGGWTDVKELFNDKLVHEVKYFNIMGQEIPAPAGLTIQVTTYTDGTSVATRLMSH